MRKLIYYVAASLDGFIARRDGSVDWLPVPQPGGEDYGYAALLARVDALVMGRKTYEQLPTFGPWPYGERRALVFSRARAGQRDEHADFIAGDTAAVVAALKEQRAGGDIWLMGGGETAQACRDAGLIDELIVTFIPVLLGDGISLFTPDAAAASSGTTVPHAVPLTLRDCRSFKDGLVQLCYDAVRQ